MIEQLDQKLRERINKAIGNIRLIATRTKRASVLDATQKAEIVANLLNEFRQHVNAIVDNDQTTLRVMSFRYDQDTANRVVAALMQADNVNNMLTKTNQKKYAEEYRQVWNLLENISTYLDNVMKKGGGNG